MQIERIAVISQDFKRALTARILLAVTVLALPVAGCAQQAQAPVSAPAKAAPRTPEPAPPTAPSAKAPAAVMEQAALDLLKRMSETLGAAKAFTYQSRSTVEVPAKTGQFVTLFGTSNVALERPNKLSVRVTGEVRNFDFYYDGINIFAFSPKDNAYSIADAPGTIDEMLKFVEHKTGIYFPSADVMFSDPYAMMATGVTSAFVVGPAAVDGFPCTHLAFRVPGVNWEIWIDTGKRALPRRLAVTYTDVRNFPRFLVEFYKWNLQPKLAASQFVFKRPPSAKQIEFGSRTRKNIQ
jgi:hypothetical protein